MTQNLHTNKEYDASQIKVLEGLEPVRQRPGMYIGSTDIVGLHHMIQEIVDNGVDEALAGHCTAISLILHEDNSVTIHDNGRGIPVDPHPKTGKSALETVFTVLHAGGKFEKNAYKISGGLHGVGASVVNALSERLEVRVHKNGKEYLQRYERGVPQGDVQVVGDTDKEWTTVSFLPDSTIFEVAEFVEGTELARMRRGAYLTPGVTFTLYNEKTGLKKRFRYEWGINTWLQNIVGEQERIASAHYINAEWRNCWAEIAFQFVNSANDNIQSFVNNIPTVDGGTHVLWFKSALLTKMNEVASEKGKIHKKIGKFQYSDITDGLYAVVTVKIPEPQFQWQTKGKLGNSYVRRQVEKIVYEYLTDYFEEHEDEFDKIFEKVHLAAKARMAARIAKETVMRKNALAGGVLPGKLSDCRKKGKHDTELFIVEGDSAWGSAKQWRDSEYQAILPLRGKVLNTEQAHIKKILANKEVKSLLTAIGCGLKDAYDEEALRYDRIIIMTDADVDGAHIKTLLLTFFYRYMKPLLEHGHLYCACPPLFKLSQGKRTVYTYPPYTLEEALQRHNIDTSKKYDAQRFKGLGEMNADQLWDTTMDPNWRKLYKITIDEAEEADRLFRILMGEDVSLRKHFILTHAKDVKELDV